MPWLCVPWQSTTAYRRQRIDQRQRIASSNCYFLDNNNKGTMNKAAPCCIGGQGLSFLVQSSTALYFSTSSTELASRPPVPLRERLQLDIVHEALDDVQGVWKVKRREGLANAALQQGGAAHCCALEARPVRKARAEELAEVVEVAGGEFRGQASNVSKQGGGLGTNWVVLRGELLFQRCNQLHQGHGGLHDQRHDTIAAGFKFSNG